MLLIALFTLFASLALGGNYRKSCCEKELAGVAYSVQNPWKEYLKNISYELRNIADIWKTPLGPSVVENFTNKYSAIVAIIDAFGNINEYAFGNLVAEATPTTRFNVYSSRDARSVMNLGAFANEEEVVAYSFLSFGRDGSVYEVTIGRPKSYN